MMATGKTFDYEVIFFLLLKSPFLLFSHFFYYQGNDKAERELFFAAGSGKLANVKKLLSEGVDLHWRHPVCFFFLFYHLLSF